jgi:hypothetical protein
MLCAVFTCTDVHGNCAQYQSQAHSAKGKARVVDMVLLAQF